MPAIGTVTVQFFDHRASRITKYDGMTKSHQKLFDALKRQKFLSYSQARQILYGDRLECDKPGRWAVNFTVHNFRKVLKRLGYSLVTRREQGWELIHDRAHGRAVRR